MKVSLQETEFEYKLTKEIPYKRLIVKDTLFSILILFIFFMIIRLYFLVPVTAIFIFFASLQTIEDTFMVRINKKKREITVYKYYMGRWKFKEINYSAKKFSFVQIEKQVTSLKDDGHFAINLLTEAPDSEKKGEVLVLLKSLDLDDIEHAKVISFLLGLIYDSRIKYKLELK